MDLIYYNFILNRFIFSDNILLIIMVLQNYCGKCGKRLMPNEDHCSGCGAKTAFKKSDEKYIFTFPIYNIGFFDLDIDFSPFINSSRKNFKYDICSCGFINSKENEYCYNCGTKRIRTKILSIFKPKNTAIFSMSNVVCSECGEINLKSSTFCEKCGNKLIEDKTPVQDFHSNFEFEYEFPVFCVCGEENDDLSQYCKNCGFPLDNFGKQDDLQKVCHCSTLNPITADFCVGCGDSLEHASKVLICVCGTKNPVTSKFCSSCERQLNPQRFVKSKLVCSCGKVMDYDTEFCPNCGKNIKKIINRKNKVRGAVEFIEGIFK